jgi:transposase
VFRPINNGTYRRPQVFVQLCEVNTMRVACAVVLSDDERLDLSRLAAGRSTQVRVAERARIVLLAADGMMNKDIATQVGTDRRTVARWRDRYVELGLEGILKDAPRGGRPATKLAGVARQIVDTTLQVRPEDATHWTVRTLAEHLGVSRSMVHRVWQANRLKPHLIETFKISNDPHFVDKLIDVVGLYLDPPEHALVLCVDEKSQIQALDRTQPSLPMKPGRGETMTHDYKRNGTTTLFAALNAADGHVISTCAPRHRHQEWLHFLKQIDKETPADLDLHLIVDNYATHKHDTVKKWLAKHPRFHVHFIPTSSSWLNLVERWFAEITRKRIRRGVFRSVEQLIEAITDFVDNHNHHDRAFTWTAKAQDILAKVARARRILDDKVSSA